VQFQGADPELAYQRKERLLMQSEEAQLLLAFDMTPMLTKDTQTTTLLRLRPSLGPYSKHRLGWPKVCLTKLNNQG